MTELVTTGPPVLAIKWGQETSDRDGVAERALLADTTFQGPEGYLHGGAAAAAALGAARLLVPDAGAPSSVAVAAHELVPLGDDLRVTAARRDDGSVGVHLERILPADSHAGAAEPLLEATVRADGYVDAPDLADVRQLAIVPIPEPQEHELHATCWACGQKNGQGLQLLPGWHAPGRVVSSFVIDDRYCEDGKVVSPIAIAGLLSCPVLWAVSHRLDDRPEDGALLATYEVSFHRELRASNVVRTVAFEGGQGRDAEFGDRDDDRFLHGVSALVDEDGQVYATASATFVAVDEMPAREPGRPAPRRYVMPHKAGRPEERSAEDWGQPLPGRREAPGPRSEQPDWHAVPSEGRQRYEGEGDPRP